MESALGGGYGIHIGGGYGIRISGGYGIRPYGVDFGRSVNGVGFGHSVNGVDFDHAVKIIGVFIPYSHDHFPRIIQHHFTIRNFTNEVECQASPVTALALCWKCHLQAHHRSD